MRIWLVTIGEPLPVQDGESDRLHRTGYLSQLLSSNGHQVVWWSSTFDHFRKKQLYDSDHLLHINDRLSVRLIHGCGYPASVSLARFRDHWQIARRFHELVRRESQVPDIIVSAFPTIELCRESTRFGIECNIPVILDMRDMWPDIFAELLPIALRPLAYILFAPLYIKSMAACRDATAITGVTEAFVDWGLRRGGRCRKIYDRSFPMGYVQMDINQNKLNDADAFWDKLGIGRDGFNVAYFGAIGRQFIGEPIIEAARILQKQNSKICFVICGSGDKLKYYKSLSSGLSNVIYPGWVGAAEIKTLMNRSFIGLAPYRETMNYTMNIPNKPAEYMSGGLPIALSLKYGALNDLIRKRGCGFSYNGDSQLLANALMRLRDNPIEREQLANNARTLYSESYNAAIVYREMMEYFELIVDEKRKYGEKPTLCR